MLNFPSRKSKAGQRIKTQIPQQIQYFPKHTHISLILNFLDPSLRNLV